MTTLTFENVRLYYEDVLSKEFPDLSQKQIKQLLLESLVKCVVLEEVKSSAHFIMNNQIELIK